jgi:AmiR/NasT family two-component response regulator
MYAFHQKSSALSGKRVVVCEDEGITQMHLALILEQSGLSLVDTVGSGPKAVTSVLEKRPDIVLMDISMPGGGNGLEAAKQIMKEYPVCIVMITAYSNEEYIAEAERIGVSGYIVKPINSDSIMKQVEESYRRFCYYHN